MHTDPSEGETEKVGTNALVTPTDEHRSGNLEDAKDRQSSSKTVIRKHWLWCAAVCVVCLFAFLQFLVIYCYKHDAGTNAGKKAGADMPALYPALQQEPDSLTTSQAIEVFSEIEAEEEEVDIEEIMEVEKESIVAECLAATGGVDSVIAETGQSNNPIVSDQNTELTQHARNTFVRKNNAAFKNDAKLTEVANAVASFYLHYPTYAECVRLTNLCCELVSSSDYTEPVHFALEGSRQIFENEIAMIGRGYTRYGRVWVDSNTLARIYVRLAQRRKEIEDYLAKQAEELRLAGIPTGGTTVERRRVRVPIGTLLKAPDRKIRRIGEDTDMSRLVEPDRKIRRIGEDTDMSRLVEPDRKIRRIGESTNLILERPDHPVIRIGEDQNTN